MLAATKIIEDLRRENAALKAKLAEAEEILAGNKVERESIVARYNRAYITLHSIVVAPLNLNELAELVKAKLAQSEAARLKAERERFALQGELIECRKQLEDERAARLKAEAACAAMREVLEEVQAHLHLAAVNDRESNVLCISVDDALATDAGQPIIDFIAAARRLVIAGARFRQEYYNFLYGNVYTPPADEIKETFDLYDKAIADVDAAELGGKHDA